MLDVDFQRSVLAEYGEELEQIFCSLLSQSREQGADFPREPLESILIRSLELHREQHDSLLYQDELRMTSYPQ